MISAVNANPQCYIYIVGAFAAVCVTCDLALSCLSQTSGSMVAFSAMLFLLGFAAQAQEELQARCAKPSPPRELHRGRSAASECEGRTGQPAARGRGGCAAAPAARPTAERGPRRAGQAVEPQPEPPERPRHIPWFVRRGLAGAQVTAEGEDTPQGPAPSRAMRQRTAADASASARKGGQAGQSPTDSTIGQQLSTRSSAVRLRTTADAAASASEGEKAGPSSTSSTEFQSDAACDAEEASTDRRPEEIPTATERTPLSREAPTFVPRTFEDPLRMLLDASAWCRQDLYAPRQYGQFPQIAAQQMDPHPVGQYDLFPHIAAQQVDTCDLAQNDHFPQIAAHQMDPCALGQYGQFPQIAAQLMGGPQDECTTVMLRNLPCPFLREDLIKAMDAKGFAGLYNFVYMPIDFQTAMGMGYAFVNLIPGFPQKRCSVSRFPSRDSRIGLSRRRRSVLSLCLGRRAWTQTSLGIGTALS
ncbi:unnamed protein product [Prorocentrum cordatum]|nr:unnamed protein product [Polarella glacialis]